MFSPSSPSSSAERRSNKRLKRRDDDNDDPPSSNVKDKKDLIEKKNWNGLMNLSTSTNITQEKKLDLIRHPDDTGNTFLHDLCGNAPLSVLY